MPLFTISAIIAGVISASALTIWLLFAVFPIGTASWVIPLVLALALIARLAVRRRTS